MTGRPGKHYRADIDGLRAIAVASVVFYHAGFGFLASGFAGVDIFFAISGYLIGGIIYNDVVNGTFRFSDFYARRARRILPALFAVVIFVCLAGLALLNATELRAAAYQATAALAGISNVWFWTDTGYFKPKAELQPLLMTWSLGVEEQFYLLFPFLILLVARLRYRYRLAALALVCAVSFAISIYLVERSQTTAFYLLPPRAWEMGLGALLAMAHSMRPGFAAGALARSNAVSLIGVVLLGVSVTVLDGLPWPGWAACVPIAGTVLVLHSRFSRINQAVLGSAPLVFIGLISYSWYLWHWPLMAFARSASDISPSLTVMTCLAALSFLLGIASQKLIETPFRRQRSSPYVTLRGYAAAMGVVIAIPVSLAVSQGMPWRLKPGVVTAERIAGQGRGELCLLQYGQDHLRTDSACIPENSEIALFGDSHAAALGSGLDEAARSRGLRVMHLYKSACSPLVGISSVNNGDARHFQRCMKFIEQAVGLMETSPALRTVVIGSAFPSLSATKFRSKDDPDVPIDTAVALRTGLGALILRLQKAGKRVIVVGDVPRFGFDPMQHAMIMQIPARRWVSGSIGTLARTEGDYMRASDMEKDQFAVDRLVKDISKSRNAEFFDLKSKMCDNHGCLFSKGGVPLYIDDHHLSSIGSSLIDWQII